MKVFVTGASGWIGSAVVPELLAAGHEVTGLARSADSADRLRAAGVTPRDGSLDDPGALTAAAHDAEAVIHLANKHDWSNMAESNRAERAAVETFAAALEGTGKPFLFASGAAFQPGTMVVETDVNPASGPESPRGGAERFAFDRVEHGLHAIALRFAPTVHGAGGEHGFIPQIVAAARRNGVAGYVGDGSSRWSAVHRRDAGALVTKALASAPAGTAVHAVAEEGIATREIAEAIGAALGIPTQSVAADDALEHFGWIGMFWRLDIPASSAATRERFDWTPTNPTLLDDIAAGAYTDGGPTD